MRVAWWILATWVAGCGGVTVEMTRAPGATLVRCQRYAWFGAVAGTKSDPQSEEGKRVREALERSLLQAGAREVTGGPADCRIAYQTEEEHKLVVSDWGSGLGGREPEVTPYSERTMIVDFVEPETDRVFWRGVARRATVPPNAADQRRLEQAVARLIAGSPATPSAGRTDAQRLSARRR